MIAQRNGMLLFAYDCMNYTIECLVSAGPVKVKMSLHVFVGVIRFRGGEIQVNDSHTMQPGDGYDISVNQKMEQKTQGCVIL